MQGNKNQKLQPEKHTFTVFAPIIYKGKYVGASRPWLRKNWNILKTFVCRILFNYLKKVKHMQKGNWLRLK